MNGTVKISGLSVGYRRHTVLSGLDWQLKPGHIYGLLGRNGAGKTTLLQTLAGGLSPLGGAIDAFGLNPFDRNEAFLSSCYLVGASMAFPALKPSVFVEAYRPFYPHFSTELYNSLAADLEVNRSTVVSKQSMGEQKRFILAFALACRARLTLLDEPLAGLDIIARGEILRAIARGDNQDGIIVISSHDTEGLENIITDLAVINDGRMILDAPVDDLSEAITCHSEGRWPDTIFADGLESISVNGDSFPSDLNLRLLFKALVSDCDFNSRLNNILKSLPSCDD